jgi:PIN domain nuclease of toxin-antitoxin system
MRFLLDTNILVPLLDNKLSSLPLSVRTLLEAQTDDFFASAGSLWEMAIKARLGKLKLPCDEQYLPEAFGRLGLRLLTISPAQVTTPVDPWPRTDDPFDRLFLSVCLVEKLLLVTLDRELRSHPLAWRA